MPAFSKEIGSISIHDVRKIAAEASRSYQDPKEKTKAMEKELALMRALILNLKFTNQSFGEIVSMFRRSEIELTKGKRKRPRVDAVRYPENAPGRYYVVSQCIDCDLCGDAAPDNFKRNNTGNYWFVCKQPENPREEARCRDAGHRGQQQTHAGKENHRPNGHPEDRDDLAERIVRHNQGTTGEHNRNSHVVANAGETTTCILTGDRYFYH